MNTIRTREIVVSAVSKGAELCSLKGKDGTEYLWQGDPEFWPRRSPLLFPIVGALPGGKFTHEGKAYALGNHGFARDMEFDLVEESGDALRYGLKSNEETLASYPFKWRLEVSYSVYGRVLTVGYRVANEDSVAMRFQIGAHPAFRTPFAEGEKRSDCELIFEYPETADRHFLDGDNLRSGETGPFLAGEARAPVSPGLFDRGAIVLMDHRSRRVAIHGRVSGRSVDVRFLGFPRLGIWAPKGDAPFVCVEPWYGVMPLAGSDPALETKEACLTLMPGTEFSASYEIELG